MPTLQNPVVETIASLQPHAIVIYRSFPKKAREKKPEELANLEKGKSGAYNGFMSPNTARTVKKFLGTWLTALDLNIKRDEKGKRVANQYYPTFITLTLPAEQFHTDNFIKRNLLNRFVQRLKQGFGVKHYFWRAEPQKTGNIHFHLIVDKYISWKSLRFEWNKILAVHGYINLYRQNQENWHKTGFRVRKDLLEKWPLEKQKAAYEAGIKENWSNPNSTDIHKINKVKNLAAYVIKYVCKSETTERKISGRIWGASDELRKLRPHAETVSISEDFTEFSNQEVTEYIAKVEAETPAEQIYTDEFVKVIRLSESQITFLSRFSQNLLKNYQSFHKRILRELYSVSAPIFEKEQISEKEPLHSRQENLPIQVSLF